MTAEQALADALAGARAADKLTRIEWRDRVAAHGSDAIEAISPWVGEPDFGAFAVRVIEAVAKFGERDAAVAALASVHRAAPTAAILGDIDAALARLRPSTSRAGARADAPLRLSTAAGWDWPGFQSSDFGQVAGTSWRRRNDPVALIPLVLRPLLEIDSGFSTYPIYQSPEVHIADRDRYQQNGEWKQGWRASKLVIYAPGPTHYDPASAPRVIAGYYVEKGTGSDEYGPVEPALWDWPRFLAFLRDPTRRRPLELATERHGLKFGDYLGARFQADGATVGFVGRLEGGRLVLRDPGGEAIAAGWDGLLKALEGLPERRWHDFHVWREWPAAEAIAMGQPFALRELVPVLADLAPIYLDIIAAQTGGARTASPIGKKRSGVLDEVSPGGPPPAQGPCQFLTTAGKACENPGRYWRDGRWSCSRNHSI
ncbi:MAG: hypothetical protein ABI620_05090 [Chloroflexota bacterium]